MDNFHAVTSLSFCHCFRAAAPSEETKSMQSFSSVLWPHGFIALTTIQVSMERFVVYEIITGYLKNHCIKHRHVCTHFDAFFMLILNMGMIYQFGDF